MALFCASYRSLSLSLLIVSDRFGNVESAERCIETLRKYRNLHPSFSKVSIDLSADCYWH